MRPVVSLLAILLLLCCACTAQDAGFPDRAASFSTGLLSRISQKTASLDQSLSSQTDKYLEKLAKKEARLRKKAFAKDSLAAAKLFDQHSLDYTAMAAKMKAAGGQIPKPGGGAYSPYLDSLQTSLKFLQASGQAAAQGPAYQAQVAGTLAQLNQLQSKMQVADQLKQQIRQHKEQIKSALSQATQFSGIQSTYQSYSKEAFYYGQQVQEYKSELSDPDKLTKRALGLMSQMPAFQDFMKNNSQLASLFSVPSGTGTVQNLAGLQTRSNVQSLLQAQVAAGGPNAQQQVQQNLAGAQAQLKTWKDKISKLGGGSSELETPDFKPNSQHTKTFFQRLEYGGNIQSTRSTYAFPTSTDLALTLGYKLNDKSTIGIGAGYKIGWGRDIHHIVVSSNGVSLRSFLDLKLKGSLYATGGYELNYQPVSPTIAIAGLHDWTRSGLVGLSKKYTINSKLKGNLQLLWDFLSYSQVPKTAPIKFRVGYNF